MESMKNIIEEMHKSTIEALKESKPGTPEWEFCMNELKIYETWYLKDDNKKLGFKKNDI